MAQADWAEFASSATTSQIERGVSAGFTPPNGGGSFVYGFNSLVSTQGLAVAKYVDLANFNPIASGKGCSVRAALKRSTATDHSVFLIGQAQGTNVSHNAYLLGIEDAEPGKLVLLKGAIQNGTPEGSSYQLAESNLPYTGGTWYHFRLDVIVNANGDVVLNVYENDLTVNTVTAPTWASVAGLGDPAAGTPSFVDDALGVNSGTASYIGGGYIGYGFTSDALGRQGYIDHFVGYRMT